LSFLNVPVRIAFQLVSLAICFLPRRWLPTTSILPLQLSVLRVAGVDECTKVPSDKSDRPGVKMAAARATRSLQSRGRANRRR